MDAETLTMTAGAVLSLGFSYIPGLASWFDRLGERSGDNGGTRKRLVMLGLLALVSLGTFGLACLGRAEIAAGHSPLGDGLFQDMGPGTAEKASQNIKHQELRQVLEQVREDYRNVLVLRFLNDLSIEETAQVMDRSAGAIRVLQHRALAAVRKLIDR